MKAKEFKPGIKFKVPGSDAVLTYVIDENRDYSCEPSRLLMIWHMAEVDTFRLHFNLSHRGIQFWDYHDTGIRLKSDFFPFSKLTLVQ